MVNFTPAAGHETPGQHPALVISSSRLNQDGFATVCHISSSEYDRFTEFLSTGRKAGADGFIHFRQMRSIDWRARQARLIGRCPDDIFAIVIEQMLALIDPSRDPAGKD
jgi:mRNA interferase MazF